MNDTLRFLCISCNEVCGIDDSGEGEYDPSAVVSLIRVLNENKSLRTLKIAENDLGDFGAGLFADALSPKCVIAALDISSNGLFGELEASLAAPRGPRRRVAVIVKGAADTAAQPAASSTAPADASRAEEAPAAPSEPISTISAVAESPPRGEPIARPSGAGGAKFIGALSGCRLTHLDLSFNDIGPCSARLLAGALAKNATLTYLELKGNPMLCEGACAIADMLDQNKSLRILGLERTGMRLMGVVRIAEAISDYESLRKLNISLNDFGDEGASKLSAALKRNVFLKYVYLHRCNIGCDGIAYISSMLQVNSTVRHIGLSCNDIGEVGIMALATSMLFNKTLVSLDISETKLRRKLGRVSAIGLEGWSALAGMIRANSSLTVLNIMGYNIPNESLEEILDAMNSQRICLVKADFRLLKWKYDAALQGIDAERNLLSSFSAPSVIRLHVCGEGGIGKSSALKGWLAERSPAFASDFLGIFSAPVRTHSYLCSFPLNVYASGPVESANSGN